eukprot:5124279-Amphidinium_carterae.2
MLQAKVYDPGADVAAKELPSKVTPLPLTRYLRVRGRRTSTFHGDVARKGCFTEHLGIEPRDLLRVGSDAVTAHFNNLSSDGPAMRVTLTEAGSTTQPALLYLVANYDA